MAAGRLQFLHEWPLPRFDCGAKSNLHAFACRPNGQLGMVEQHGLQGLSRSHISDTVLGAQPVTKTPVSVSFSSAEDVGFAKPAALELWPFPRGQSFHQTGQGDAGAVRA